MAETTGRWHLDEGAGQLVADATGLGHDGRLGALASDDTQDPQWIGGRLGAALRFDGNQNQYVAIASSAGFDTPRVSVRAWVRRLGTPGSYRYVVASGASGCHSAPYGLYSAPSGGLAFYISDSSRSVLSPEAAPQAVWDGAWHHATGTYDGRHVRLYFDGREVGQGTPSQLAIAYGTSAPGVYIGTYRGSCDLPFTGDVDEVAIDDRALSPPEVAVAAAPVARPPAPLQLPPVSGPPVGQAGALVRSVACLSVAVWPRRVVAGRPTSLKVTVKRSARPVARRSVSVRGPGLSRRVRTGRRGSVRLVVRVGRSGRLQVKAAGQPPGCAPRLVPVARSAPK